MTLLEDESPVVPDPGDETPLADDLLAPAAVDVSVDDGQMRCRNCGTALADGEGWCLTCGTATAAAAPRRTPGLRAVMLAGSVALVLAGGAVAASYAALNDEPPPQQVKVQTLAKLTPVPTVEETTATTTDTPLPEPTPLPVDTTPVTPITPVTPVTPVTPTTPTTTSTTTAAPKPGTVPILVALTAGQLYDPSSRATASGVPSRALDGDPNTSWFVTTPPGADMDTGYLIDLEDPVSVLKLRLLTKTPGFSMQVFAANGEKAPAAADSPDWKRIGEVGSVDGDAPEGSASTSPPAEGDKAGDGELVLPLDPGTKTYRWVMLWVTTPPAAGTTVRFNEIRLYS